MFIGELTPDWHKIYCHQHGAGEEESKQCSTQNAPLSDHLRGDRCCLRLQDLDSSESSDQNAKDYKERNDAAVAPGVRRAAPLEGEQQAYYSREEEKGT